MVEKREGGREKVKQKEKYLNSMCVYARDKMAFSYTMTFFGHHIIKAKASSTTNTATALTHTTTHHHQRNYNE